MSFTIKCNECGNEEVFKDGDSPYGDNIGIDITEICGFQGCEVISKDISCSKCSNLINL